MTIDPSLMQSIVAKALMDQMDPAQRDTLIQSALQTLLTPPVQTNYHGTKPVSPLQQAFNDACSIQARKLCMEMLENDAGIQEQIKTLLREAVERLCGQNREATIIAVADRITAGLIKDTY